MNRKMLLYKASRLIENAIQYLDDAGRLVDIVNAENGEDYEEIQESNPNSEEARQLELWMDRLDEVSDFLTDAQKGVEKAKLTVQEVIG